MKSIHRIAAAILVLGAAVLAAPPPVFAEVVKLTAQLVPDSGPADAGTAQGKANFSYDTDTMLLTYVVVYDHLSGPATGADIREAPQPGSPSRIVVVFPVPESPIGGTATLSDAQAAELLAGKFAVDVRTDANGGGEIIGTIHR